MSNFLSNGGSGSGGSAGIQFGASPLDFQPTQRELALREWLFKSTLQIPKDFETWMIDRIAISGLPVSISQITGFTGFTVQAATRINVSESTSSAAYTDLATVGPSLTGLPDGQYAISFGCTGVTGGGQAFMSLSANGAAAADADALSVASNVSATVSLVYTLNNAGNNSLVAKYRSTSGSSTFTFRWLTALKFANA